MIYCIAGPPRIGKSTLACRLAARLESACLPIDTIRIALESTTSPTERAGRFPVWATRAAYRERADQLWIDHSADELIDAYRTEAASCWPAVQAIARFFHHRHETVVLEGCQLWPGLVGRLEAELGEGSLTLATLTWTKQGATDSLRQQSAPASWLTGNDPTEATLDTAASFLVALGSQLAGEAEQADWPVFTVDTDQAAVLTDALSTLARQAPDLLH